MSKVIREKEYRCSDDCRMEGCPSHTAKLTFYSVSDGYEFDNGHGGTYTFERGELEAFIDLLKNLDRADAVNIQ